jgi:hypothetical protein
MDLVIAELGFFFFLNFVICEALFEIYGRINSGQECLDSTWIEDQFALFINIIIPGINAMLVKVDRNIYGIVII